MTWTCRSPAPQNHVLTDDPASEEGDALLIDNARCNHSRTAFDAQQDLDGMRARTC